MTRQKMVPPVRTSHGSRPKHGTSLSPEQVASGLVAGVLDEDGFYSDIITNTNLAPIFDAVRRQLYPDLLDLDAVDALRERLDASMPKSAAKDLEQLYEQGSLQASLSLRVGFAIGAAYGRRVVGSAVQS